MGAAEIPNTNQQKRADGDFLIKHNLQNYSKLLNIFFFFVMKSLSLIPFITSKFLAQIVGIW